MIGRSCTFSLGECLQFIVPGGVRTQGLDKLVHVKLFPLPLRLDQSPVRVELGDGIVVEIRAEEVRIFSESPRPVKET